MSDVFDRIRDEIGKNDVLLFMKGTPVFPQCGFSAAVVDVLSQLGVKFHGINILTDGEDATSTISLDTLLTQLKQRQDPAQPVHIVTIAYGADANEGVLKQIAAATGGTFFSAKDPRSINTVFISALAALAQ